MRLSRVVIVGFGIVKNDSDSLFVRQNASAANKSQKAACLLRVGARAKHVQEAVVTAAEIRDAAVNCRSSDSVRWQHNPHIVVGPLNVFLAFVHELTLVSSM
jgi:hypothetical protein